MKYEPTNATRRGTRRHDYLLMPSLEEPASMCLRSGERRSYWPTSATSLRSRWTPAKQKDPPAVCRRGPSPKLKSVLRGE
ncbi:unnamed protein product [Linum trigynum]|uniref:Uncharacterized protein n=1 Tax=Linum trigynum TaxID=586398 RepID=A0AAV2ECZ3_9ROSI